MMPEEHEALKFGEIDEAGEAMPPREEPDAEFHRKLWETEQRLRKSGHSIIDVVKHVASTAFGVRL